MSLKRIILVWLLILRAMVINGIVIILAITRPFLWARRSKPAVLLVATALFLSPSAATSQEPPSYLHQLTPGATARVRLQSGEMMQAQLLRVRTDTLLMSGHAGSRLIPVNSVDSLWVRGSHLRSGTIVGAAAGAALGVAFTVALVRGNCDAGYSCESGYLLAIPIGLVVALPGALVGSLIGSLVPRWDLRFP